MTIEVSSHDGEAIAKHPPKSPPFANPLLSEVERLFSVGDLKHAAAQLRNSIVPDLDFTSAISASRYLAKARSQGVRGSTPLRLAVLGGATTKQLTEILDLFLFARNIEAEIYQAPYGVFRQEILDETSELYRIRPQIIFLATSRRDLRNLPALSDDPESVQNAVDVETKEWLMLWETAHNKLGCQIIQNNFDSPPWRALGHYEMSHAAAPANFIQRVNQELVLRAPRWVTIHDLDNLVASAGRWNWGDERYYHFAKLPCAPESLVSYANSVAALVSAHLGKSRKCLVLDLDNTLWGGVIGDDGLGGIALGQGDAMGESFVAFQCYIKSLRDRGVILAVCSKNEDENAREPFEKHREMVLRLEDISCFMANWDDKATNLRSIAQQLNIGLESIVFVDDNPAERAFIQKTLPDVAVPEMPLDPANYICAIEKHRYFEIVALSSEDFQRTEYYRANVQRQQVESSETNLEQFLNSLEMRAWIGSIGDLDFNRSVQLIGKSNQFNLTTPRYSAADVQQIVQSPEWLTRVVKLSDRFGDNGLIAVLLARQQREELTIDTWLMSCRVLKRGVEQFLLNNVVEFARKRGLCRLSGDYIPTGKNKLVEQHYANLGFTQVESNADGRTRWQLNITGSWAPLQHYIQEERS